MDKDGDDQRGDDPKPRKVRARKVVPADRNEPYEVGKGKPPKEHQFKPGNTRGGRKRGSTNKDSYRELLDRKVVAGRDVRGRPLRRSWRLLIDLQLLKKAAEGDLAAIRLVKEFEFKMAGLHRAGAGPMPTIEELRQDARNVEERKRNTDKLVKSYSSILELVGHLKKVGLVAIDEAGTHFTQKGMELLRKAEEQGF